MTLDLLRNAQRVFYSDLRFTAAVECILVTHTIYLAQLIDKPLTTSGLAKRLDIPRATLQRRLLYLERKHFIARQDHGRLIFNTELLATPEAMRNVRRARKLVIEAAAKLTKMGT